MNTAQSKRRQESSDYSRPIMIHVCKDGTVTYRRPGEPVFNGVAIPVFSVNTPEQAEAIHVRFCRRQYGEHPQMPGTIWYRLSRLGDGFERLMLAAKRWARFQGPDGLEDQKTDTVLQAEAIEAREALLTIVEELP